MNKPEFVLEKIRIYYIIIGLVYTLSSFVISFNFILGIPYLCFGLGVIRINKLSNISLLLSVFPVIYTTIYAILPYATTLLGGSLGAGLGWIFFIPFIYLAAIPAVICYVVAMILLIVGVIRGISKT